MGSRNLAKAGSQEDFGLWNELASVLNGLELADGPSLTLSDVISVDVSDYFLPFSAKGVASDEIKRITNARQHIGKALSGLIGASEPVQRYLALLVGPLNEPFSDLEEESEGANFTSSGLLPQLETIEHYLGILEIELVRKKSETWDKNGTNVPAPRLVARAVGDLYVRLRSKPPGIGKDPQNSNEPSTPFGRVVKKVYNIKGIDAHFYDPCLEVVRELKEY